MAEKEHELTRWLRRVRITKRKMASDINVNASTISRNTNGGRVSDNMIIKYRVYGVPESIINKMMKQG